MALCTLSFNSTVLKRPEKILGIGDSWQYVVKGAVLLVAVIFSVVTKKGKN